MDAKATPEASTQASFLICVPSHELVRKSRRNRFNTLRRILPLMSLGARLGHLPAAHLKRLNTFNVIWSIAVHAEAPFSPSGQLVVAAVKTCPFPLWKIPIIAVHESRSISVTDLTVFIPGTYANFTKFSGDCGTQYPSGGGGISPGSNRG